MSGEPLTLADIEGAMPAAAVMCLGHRLAAIATQRAFDPDRIVIAADDAVSVEAGPVAQRWLAPEVRDAATHTAAAEMWSLGRLLLELSLGRTVDDSVVDHADEAGLKSLMGVDGQPLPDRVIDILAVLLKPQANERLQSTRAAERVFRDAEGHMGDGARALGEILERARLKQRGRGGVGRAEEPAPVTIGLASRDILDGPHLKQLAAEAEAIRRAQQAAPLKATKDLPARAILSPEELKKIDAGAARLEQKLLPTQIVPRGQARSADVVDGEAVTAAVPQPRLLGPGPEEPVTEPADLVAVAVAPVVAPVAAPVVAAPVVANAAPATAAADVDAEVESFLDDERRRRRLLAAAAAAFVVVVGVIAIIVAASGGEPPVHVEGDAAVVPAPKP